MKHEYLSAQNPNGRALALPVCTGLLRRRCRAFAKMIDKNGQCCQPPRPIEGHGMIDFKNLIVGSHESKVLFTWNVDHDAAMLGAFLGIEDGIESILARDETTPVQRAILEEFRTIAGKSNWDFAALRESLHN